MNCVNFLTHLDCPVHSNGNEIHTQDWYLFLFRFIRSLHGGAGSGGDRLGGDGHWGRAGDPAKRVEGSLGELGGALRVAATGKREQLLHQRPMRPPGVFPGKLPLGDDLLGAK